MQTKSKIQLIIEKNKAKEIFGNELINLLERYNIQDNIFIYNEGKVMEFKRGYFVLDGEYNNITEALRNFDVFTQSIRIINNEKFHVGKTYNLLQECNGVEKPILDVTQNTYVY